MASNNQSVAPPDAAAAAIDAALASNNPSAVPANGAGDHTGTAAAATIDAAADAAKALVLLSRPSAQDSNAEAGDAPQDRPSGIMGLSRELLDRIVTYIGDKHDLAQLCKTNRWFRVSATPALYQSVTIDLGEILHPLVMQMLTAENAGLNHIKNLTVRVDEKYDPEVEQNGLQALGVLINRIPPNQLLWFSYERPQLFSHRLLAVLWKRQRNLKWLEIFGSRIEEQDGPQVNLHDVFVNTAFPNLQGVRAMPRSSEAARLTSTALKRPGVTHLEVDGLMWEDGDAHVEALQDEDTQQTVSDGLTESIFAHITRVAPGRPANCSCLASLCLKNINVTLCKRTWFTYLDLSRLKDLKLEYCIGADLFLLQLACGAAAPALRSFQLIHNCHEIGTNADRTIHAIEELLSFPTHKMEILKLTIRNADKLPGVDSIRNHSRSLKKLLLDVEPRHHQVLKYLPEDFVALMQSCSSLVELGIGFHAIEPDYRDLEFDYTLFWESIEAVSSHVNLRTLNILTLPRWYETWSGHTGKLITANLQLARVASEIFYFHRNPNTSNGEHRARLEVIAFGTLERCQDSLRPPPVYYVPCEQRIMGRTSRYALEVDLEYLRGQALDIEILDYGKWDFQRQSRAAMTTQLQW